LIGISPDQIKDHWGLYKGYVEQVNKLNKELAQLRSEGKGGSLDYSDRRRRYGFEYNGMVLHEYYFGNLKVSKTGLSKGDLFKAIESSFGSYKAWEEDFKSAGKTRGIGWAILCIDPENDQLINIFVQDHEIGSIAAFPILLVMDVWEHAYMGDYRANERPNYIDAFMKNINWDVVELRYNDVKNGKINKRF